ncbi:UvrD-helicase domain-containing protein [Hydrogenophaga laconesensis]|uniref:DNA 3'-5' helicase n=1 Tax=Hydrogenophaga laconesensis TaxID=1805971 RepID=A0ABU1VFL9_9BURK|nr:UvrD-helicase domain-containing protein [Hydrogenophaga laconesensis]MDR7096135.1 ATP-dependent helicase/nuclease subunit A [Hydrogenophaga laconesensis]
MTAPAYRINGTPVSREAFYVLACDPTRSIAVEACAGAGKTWMLVSRILRALLDGCAPQDVLAITFTKKAAGEMRDRLNTELRRWAGLSDEALAGELRARGMSEADAMRRVPEARSLYQRVTALGRSVQVRTFHSWFAALLRGAPLSVLQELQLPVQYELLEDDARAVAQVWPRFYAALAASPAERQDFMDSVAGHGRHQTLKALQNALQKRVEFTLADAAGIVDVSVEPMAHRYPEFGDGDSPVQWLVRDARAVTLMREAAQALGRASAVTFSAKGVELEQALSGSNGAAVLAALLTQKDEPRKFNDKLAGIEAVRAAQQLAMRAIEALRQHRAWQHHQRLSRLTRVLLDTFAAFKRERGWVDMNDVEGAARRLLADAELSGWLQQRLDARLRHVLIDEFQDTNPLQWQALYGWLSAYAGAGPGEAPCVFLVGDPKQSIYRFRRAEPQVFKAAQAFVVQGLSGALLSCDHTRRCAPEVVDALNAAMGAAVLAGEYGSDYRAHTTESKEPGEVLCLPQVPRSLREQQNSGEDGEPVWRDSLSQPRVSTEDGLAVLEARQAADWIAAEVAAGRLALDDVMVLARRRERLGWMHEALRERGLASEQPEKLELGEAPAVQDVVALLDALVSTRHDLSLARALKSPLFDWRDDDLAQLARLRLRWTPPRTEGSATVSRPAWWDVLSRFATLTPQEQAATATSVEQARRFTLSAERLALYRGWLRSLPPHDALSALYDHGDVLARFAQAVPVNQRDAVLAQLRDLLSQSLAQDGGRFLTPYRLVRALKAGGIQATPVRTHGAVRLLTIHGAKGLEAHTVLILDTASGSARPESMGVLVDWPGEEALPRRFVFLASEKTPPACVVDALRQEQEARSLEELNALYVALTRAESRLVISSFEPHQRSATTWFDRLQPLTAPVGAPTPFAQEVPFTEVLAPAFTLPSLPALTVEFASPAPPVEQAPVDDTYNRMGLALHRLLEWRPTPVRDFEWTPEHVEAVAREFSLDTVQSQHVLATAGRIVAGEAAWVWDDAALDHWGNEVALLHQGELLRLDRLVRRRDSGEWWVLDYKSAARPELDPAKVAQMHGYRAAMAQARPGEPVRLAFINAQGRLIELADAFFSS